MNNENNHFLLCSAEPLLPEQKPICKPLTSFKHLEILSLKMLEVHSDVYVVMDPPTRQLTARSTQTHVLGLVANAFICSILRTNVNFLIHRENQRIPVDQTVCPGRSSNHPILPLLSLMTPILFWKIGRMKMIFVLFQHMNFLPPK